MMGRRTVVEEKRRRVRREVLLDNRVLVLVHRALDDLLHRPGSVFVRTTGKNRDQSKSERAAKEGDEPDGSEMRSDTFEH